MSEHASSLHIEYEPPRSQRSSDGIKYYGEAAVDVIAVQGLGSSYDWTWSTEIPHSDGARYRWLKESVPVDLPHACVLAYDYDTSWFGDPTRTSLEECGSRLLRTIIAERTHSERTKMCPYRARRPIIFIGHSFGGLVIKQSLVLANRTDPTDQNYEDHQAYLNAVTAVIYLGTPHRGSSFPSFAKVKIQLGNRFGARSDDRLLRILSIDSEILTYVQHEYESLERKPQLADIRIYCYYEKKEVRLGPFPIGFVVPEASACLESATIRGLEKNHMSLNKFAPDDKEYKEQLRVDLLSCFEAADRIARTRFSLREYGSEAASAELQNLKRFMLPLSSSMKDRLEFNLSKQERIHQQTCSWIHNVELFNQWRTRDELSCLWIHGKSGSGKSILAAYIAKTLQPKGEETSWDDLSCASLMSSANCDIEELGSTVLYFLCGVQPALESPSNMLGTLIDQLLSRYSRKRNLQVVAVRATNKLKAGGNVQELANLLGELSSIVGGVHIIIDGLEENSRYAQCIEALKLSSGRCKMRLLFTSQGIYLVEQAIRRAFPEVKDINILNHTKDEIDAFIVSKTAQLVSLKPSLKVKQDFIVQELQSKAKGSYQWVQAILTHLDEDTGRAEDVELKLTEVDHDITDTYDKIMTRLLQKAQSSNRKRIECALLWLYSAAVPLDASQLFAAILLEDRFLDITWEEIEHSEDSDHTAAQHIRALLGSTVELFNTGTGQYLVQLFHPSFREYLASTDITRSGTMQQTFNFTPQQAQGFCAAMSMAICSKSGERLSQGARLRGQHLLEDYAWRFWSYHFQQSGLGFDTRLLASLFDMMIKSVSSDILAVLEGLAQFVTRRFAVDDASKNSRLHFVRAFQVAQGSLKQPMINLVQLRKNLPISQELQQQRELVCNTQEQNDQLPANTVLSSIVALLPRQKTRPSRLEIIQTDSIGSKNTSLELSSTVKMLGDIARGLRVAAGAFAIDPVFTQMTAHSDVELSIITMLSQVGNLFDNVSSYPYWDSISDFPDTYSPFETSKDDRFAHQALLVLYRARMDGGRSLEIWPTTSSADRLSLYSRMKSSTRADIGLSATQWYTAKLSYSNFLGTGPSLWRMILGPAVSIHMQQSMHLDVDFASSFNPESILDRYYPEELAENAFWAFITAIPSLFSIFVADFIKYLLDAFDRAIWPQLISHWNEIRVSVTSLHTVWQTWRLVENLQSSLTYIHLVLGFALYLTRTHYFSWYAADSSPHPLRDIYDVFNDPEQFFKHNSHDWKWWLQYYIIALSASTVGAICGHVSWKPNGFSKVQAWIACIYVAFWSFCVFEQTICRVVNAVAWTFMYASLLVRDEETIIRIVQLSVQYWYYLTFSIANSAIMLAVIQIMGLFWLFVWVPIFVTFLWYISRYDEQIAQHVGNITRLVRAIAWAILPRPLEYLRSLWPVLGPLLAMSCMFYGVDISWRFYNDPLGLGTTGKELQDATLIARPALQDRSPFRIGYVRNDTLESSNSDSIPPTSSGETDARSRGAARGTRDTRETTGDATRNTLQDTLRNALNPVTRDDALRDYLSIAFGPEFLETLSPTVREGLMNAFIDANGISSGQVTRNVVGHATRDMTRDVAKDTSREAAESANTTATRDMTRDVIKDASREVAESASTNAAKNAYRDALRAAIGDTSIGTSTQTQSDTQLGEHSETQSGAHSGREAVQENIVRRRRPLAYHPDSAS